MWWDELALVGLGIVIGAFVWIPLTIRRAERDTEVRARIVARAWRER